MINIYSKHTTCGVKIMEKEILSFVDIINHLEKSAPEGDSYQHDRIELRQVPLTERINGVSHVRMLYFPLSESIPVIERQPQLGKWQRIFLIEMDFAEPFREREIVLTLYGE